VTRDISIVPNLISSPSSTSLQSIDSSALQPTMSTAPVFRIVPGLQSYAWGKTGSSSLAAQLGSRSIPDYEIDDEKPYAEVCLSLSLSPVARSGQTTHHIWPYIRIT